MGVSAVAGPTSKSWRPYRAAIASAVFIIWATGRWSGGVCAKLFATTLEPTGDCCGHS